MSSTDKSERKYLKALMSILNYGSLSENRTDTSSYRKSGVRLAFSLVDHTVPLLTTKQVYWKTVLKELLWFIEGGTSSKTLSERGVRIWDDNGSREFLDARGLQHHTDGDLGPVYGFQWRHYGAKYRGPDVDYAGEGIDQLANVIKGIRTDPYSRRHIINAWNPLQLNDMALPPCHYSIQFNVLPAREGMSRLDCIVTQRSGDMFLGVPFNIASYAFLTHMIAYLTGMEPGSVTLMIGDAHIYVNHKAQCEEQLTRVPYTPPTLTFARTPEEIGSIDGFQLSDFRVVDYTHHPAIRAPMAI
jgi:thymidylate synthase